MAESHSEALEKWLTQIEGNHPSEIEMGLDRVLTVYSKFRTKRLAKQVVLVAGTNGKGSTVAVLEKLLLAAGKTVGVYSSPHINIYNERIRINGDLIDDKRLVESFQNVEQVRGNIPLTYFEFGTLGAIACLQKEALDIVLLEVGLGGRLDAVNIVDPDLSIITSVDIDHTEWLGNDRESIGFEKAGIFRKDIPAIYGGEDPPESVLQQAVSQSINLHVFQAEFGLSEAEDSSSDQYDWVYQPNLMSGTTRKKAYIQTLDKTSKTISMPFSLLPESNILAAVQAMECLGYSVTNEKLAASLDGFSVKGRFDIQSTQPLVVFDVGHNPHAARFLSRRLAGIKGARPVYAVFSVLADKDVDGIVEGLIGEVEHWFIAPLSGERAMALSLIEKTMDTKGQHYSTFSSLGSGFEKALELAKENDGIVICFGSFHVVSDIS